MQKRHDNLLTARLEHVVDAGVAHILWNELYTWYDVKKIAAGTYRDLNQRWDEITDGDEGRLMKIEGAGGIFLAAENEVMPLFEEKVSSEE
ncbi:hypothetical protein [Parasphingorhabdus sp.]|uniref:hypothetical protein n=1 Tax=Parasphingorhabdus sp. TaxID=2709688 RepID=UPI0032ED8519